MTREISGTPGALISRPACTARRVRENCQKCLISAVPEGPASFCASALNEEEHPGEIHAPECLKID